MKSKSGLAALNKVVIIYHNLVLTVGFLTNL